MPEFQFKTSRSGGAGGQHVNKTETKVELIFDVNASITLNEAEKARILDKLAGNINEEGQLRLNSSESRSQLSNKENVIEKFYALLENALKKEKKRIPTVIPEAIKEGILKTKKLHSRKKAERRLKPRDFI